MGRISLTRRITQAVSFVAIVFGGFLLGPGLDRGRGEVITASGYSGTFERGDGVRWVERERAAVGLHLPATSCYYQHRGLFSGCSLLFVSEHLAELTPLFYVLPYLLLLLALMFALGRLWCGWICPFGLLSDLLTGLRRLLGVDHWVLPRRWREALVWTKYVLLAATVALSLLAAVPALAHYRPSLFLPFCQICLGKFASPLLSFATICWVNWRDPITSALSVLGVLTLGLFFLGFSLRRAYCRVCPVGGLTAPFNRVGLLSLRKRAGRCTRCGACARVCHLDNLRVMEGREDRSVDACECMLCLRCVEACPEPGCLELSLAGRRIVGS